MKTYLVGGAVRDALLGIPVKDRDWVVVGSSPQAMHQAGYITVGRDFPVFIHPQSHEEYALARTERKIAKGYHGFTFNADPEVTLEQDLSRRDLTINAIAQDEQGRLTDPYHGQRDIQQKILRHVTLAFREDPVRILRVARFAARFSDFTVAPETMVLMQGMVANGEAGSLVAERVWQELAKGLMTPKPSRMFEILRQAGLLQSILPELSGLWGVPQPALHHPEIDTGLHVMMVLDMAAKIDAPLSVRFACLMHDLGKGTTPKADLPRHPGHEMRSVKQLMTVCERWRIPSDLKETAIIVAREHGNIHRSADLNAAATLRLLERCDALRRPERFAQVLQACECDARGRAGLQNSDYPQAKRLALALKQALAVLTKPIADEAAQAGLLGSMIGERIAQARVNAIHSGQ